MRYQVTGTRSMVLLGKQPRSTITNVGSSTIFLSATSDVTPENGYPLHPGETLSWNENVEVWSVCTKGMASWMTVTPFGGLLANNYPHYRDILWQSPVTRLTGDTVTLSPHLEAGNSRTLIIDLIYRECCLPTDGAKVEVMFYDDSKRRVDYSVIYPWVMLSQDEDGRGFYSTSNSRPTRIRIPIKGSYFRVRHQFPGATSYFGMSVSGSTDAPSSIQHYIVGYQDSPLTMSEDTGWDDFSVTYNTMYHTVFVPPLPPIGSGDWRVVYGDRAMHLRWKNLPANPWDYALILPNLGSKLSVTWRTPDRLPTSLGNGLLIRHFEGGGRVISPTSTSNSSATEVIHINQSWYTIAQWYPPDGVITPVNIDFVWFD